MKRSTLHWLGIIGLPLVTFGLIKGLQRDFTKPNYEYFADMAYSPAYHAQEPNPVFASGITEQLPVPGTLPRGATFFPYGPSEEDNLRAGEELVNPFKPTEENLKRGKHLFETFCAPCHGFHGNGDGPLIPKYPNPPSFKTARFRSIKDGSIYHTITYGKRKMPSHASQIKPEDRWKIILYVNKLRFGE
ncbi:MAG: cytochrome c [Calditrichaeota bacterium]|nr:MAG: cytochrome c [Calditrichota bacterium]